LASSAAVMQGGIPAGIAGARSGLAGWGAEGSLAAILVQSTPMPGQRVNHALKCPGAVPSQQPRCDVCRPGSAQRKGSPQAENQGKLRTGGSARARGEIRFPRLPTQQRTSRTLFFPAGQGGVYGAWKPDQQQTSICSRIESGRGTAVPNFQFRR
jgi:hypothetical protein